MEDVKEEDVSDAAEASEQEDDEVEPDADDETMAKTLNTFERAKGVEFDGKLRRLTPNDSPAQLLNRTDTLLPEWKKMPIHPLLKKGLHKLGFTKPTEIQKQAIPIAVNGTAASSGDEDDGSDEDMENKETEHKLRDVVGVAETVGHTFVVVQVPRSSGLGCIGFR